MPLLENVVMEYRIDVLDKEMSEAWRNLEAAPEDPAAIEAYRLIVEAYTAARVRRPAYK